MLIACVFLIVVFVLLMSLVSIKNSFLFFLLAMIVVPKINLINLEGTYIGIRLEDFSLAIIVYMSALCIFMKHRNIQWPKFTFPILIYVFVTGISYVMGVLQGTITDNMLGLMFFLRRVEYFLPFFLAFWMLGKDDLPKINWIFMWIYLVTAVVAILQWFQLIGGFYLGEFVSSVGDRVFSTFSGPYEYAFYLAMSFTYWVVEYFKKKRSYILLFLSSCYLLLTLTASRVTIVSVILCSIMAAFLERKARTLILLLITLTAITCVFYLSVPQNRFSMLFSAKNIPFLGGMIEEQSYDQSVVRNLEVAGKTDVDISAVYRVIKWNKVLSKFAESPMLGNGPSAFGEAVDGNYIRILGENGIISMLAFVWLMYNIVSTSIVAYRAKVSNETTKEISMFVLLISGVALFNALFTDVFEASKFAIIYWSLIGIYCRVLIPNEFETLEKNGSKVQ